MAKADNQAGSTPPDEHPLAMTRPFDHQGDKAHEVVAHVVEGVAAPLPCAPALACAEIRWVDLELAYSEGYGLLEPRPGFGLAGDEHEGRARR